MKISPPLRPASAFTLVELLVTIAIIGVLASIAMVAVSRARDAARNAKCLATIRGWVVAVPLYAGDHRGALPSSTFNLVGPVEPGETNETLITLAPYLGAASNWSNHQQFLYTQDHQCPVDSWGYGCNSYVSKMKLAAITQPSQLIYLMDTAKGGRWVGGTMLNATGPTSAGKQLKYTFPRPHNGKVSVAYLDGRAEQRKVTSLTIAMFSKDTPNYVTAHDTRYVMTESEEAAAETAAAEAQ